MLTETYARTALERFVLTFPTQSAAAKALGVSDAFLSDLRANRRGLTDRVLVHLGLEKVVGYRRIKRGCA